jgi:hypothetical protein
MEMYLGEIPVSIMLIGMCSSDAILCYIRKQGEQFSRNILKKMLTFGHSVIYGTLLLDEFLQKTPGSATIVIMLRRGVILEATNHDGHSYQLSPFTPNQWTEHLFPTAKDV